MTPGLPIPALFFLGCVGLVIDVAREARTAPTADREGRSVPEVVAAAGRMGVAKREARNREAAAERERVAAVPLAPFLCGDKSGLPMRPPGSGSKCS